MQATPWVITWRCLVALSLAVPLTAATELKPATIQAFERYVQAAEARIGREENDPPDFLYVDGLNAPEHDRAFVSLKRGGIFIAPLNTPDASGRSIEAPGGLIHDWIGVVFIRGASLRQTIDLLQDYDHHYEYFKPEVIGSRLMSRQGNDFKIFLRFREKKVVTVVLDTEHEVHYTPIDSNHWYSRSFTTRIAQVEDPGKPAEHELPVGDDGGYLWRMNTYWEFEERDGGVYVQCESISLSRDIPRGLGWMLEPFVTSVPKESLQDTLDDLRAAVLQKVAGMTSARCCGNDSGTSQ
jgi:hypothetical protein